MQLINVPDYQTLSQACADEMITLIREKPDAKIILATGSSPALAYRLFVKAVTEQKIDVSRVTWIKLDEWTGLPPEHASTCDYFIRQSILIPLHISENRYLAIDQTVEDIDKECKAFEQRFSVLDGIDMAILGIGKNGHIALNEPGTQLPAGVHVTVLDAKTRTHTMLTDHDALHVTHGVTLGFRNIFCANRIILLFTGQEKQENYKILQQDMITMRVPVTLLQLHQNTVCYVDENAK